MEKDAMVAQDHKEALTVLRCKVIEQERQHAMVINKFEKLEGTSENKVEVLRSGLQEHLDTICRLQHELIVRQRSEEEHLRQQAHLEKQLVQMKLANMSTEWNLAFLSCLHVAELVDNRNYKPEMISLIKRNSCSKSLDIVRNGESHD